MEREGRERGILTGKLYQCRKNKWVCFQNCGAVSEGSIKDNLMLSTK